LQQQEKHTEKRTGKFESAVIVEMLSAHFSLSNSKKKVDKAPICYPMGGTMLAIAAVSDN
jgi:hypothetical protein